MSESSKKALLRQYYLDLAKAEKSGDYDRAFRAANRILKAYPHEAAAFKCKVVCLIQLEKFDDAIQVIKKNPPKLSGECIFERAYCEYRLNKDADALATLESQERDSLSLACLELLAQLFYRMNNFEECQKIYKKLLKESADEYDELRGANLQAVEIQMAHDDPSVSSSIDVSGDSYEQLYNDACRKIIHEDYRGALTNLNKAETLCREILTEDEVPEDEIEDEVGVMRAQAAYCHQMLGNHEKALHEYTEIIKLRPNDAVLMAVASNNTVSLRKGEQNLFDSRKKLKAAQGQKVEKKFSLRQKKIACYNNALLQLHSNQFELCRKALAELKSKYGAKEDAILIEAALLCRQKETGKALEITQAFVKSLRDANQDVSSQLHFALAQLHLSEGEVSPALRELNEVEEAKWTPGVISLVVCANVGMEKQDAAVKTLQEAIKHFQSTTPDSPKIAVLMDECAGLYLQAGKQKEATQYLENLRKLKPNDPQILSRLIQAYSQFDPKKADEVSRTLPQLGKLDNSGGLDVDELESSGWILMGERYRQKKEAKQTPKPGKENPDGTLKPKRKRKTKLPKNLDPSIPIDPERWIPKYERSTYRKKKDKRAKDREIGRGTQGAAGGGNADLDATGKAPAATPASPKPGSAGPTPQGPRQNRPGAKKAPAKKKKGIKW